MEKHECVNEERLKELESKQSKYEIIKIILTPKMVIAICLGASFLIQMLRGG